MPTPVMCSAALLPHPDSGNCPVRSIRARVSRDTSASLAIRYAIEGAITRVRVPAPSSPRFIDGLWQHTCCECFIAVNGEAEYHEFNFSPSREWAAYGFADYRQGGPLNDNALNPRITVTTSTERIELNAVIGLERLSRRYKEATVRLGLSVVIEDTDGVLSYWALRHPGEKPDFHDRRSFLLEMAPTLALSHERGTE